MLDRIGAFDVFASPWFSAIYLLLFTSLIGCMVPRLRDHVRALRAPPPEAPKRLERLPQHAELVAGTAARRRSPRCCASGAGGWWSAATRWSAEKGYLKETGNLLFHFSLLAVLIGVALGSWYGWHGNRLLVAGADNGFCNTRQQYDESDLGPQVDDADLPQFCLTLDDFEARFLPTGSRAVHRHGHRARGRRGARGPRSSRSTRRCGSTTPTCTCSATATRRSCATPTGTAASRPPTAPFLAQDGKLTSEGVAAFPDVNIDPATGERDESLQIAFEGIYLPTAPEDVGIAVSSQFPEPNNPAIFLIAYRGNLGLDAGIPGSVYNLDQTQMRAGRLTQIGNGKLLKPGESWTLDDGTTLEFLGTKPYITISVRHDPGSTLLLVSSTTLLLGLLGSLFGKRRRIWFRVAPAGTAATGATTGGGEAATAATTSGSRLVAAGGLPRTDYPGFADEFAEIIAAIGGDRSAETGTNGTAAAETGNDTATADDATTGAATAHDATAHDATAHDAATHDATTHDATTGDATEDESAGAARRDGAAEGTT